MRFRAVDIETTGLDPAEDAIIEIGWRGGTINHTGKAKLDKDYQSTLVFSTKAIPAEVSAVHHLMNADLRGAPMRNAVVRGIVDTDLVVAHNADFEQSFLPEFAAVPWVCTFRAALRLVPDATSHSNQALRYHFGVAISPRERTTLSPHRAGPDAYVTALIFARLLELAPLKELVRISTLPPLFRSFNFGKHKGQPIEHVPQDYFDWCLRQPDMDVSVRHSIACEMARRNGGDAEAYFSGACRNVDGLDQTQLDDWWRANAVARAKNWVRIGTPLYERLIDYCAKHKAKLNKRVDSDERVAVASL